MLAPWKKRYDKPRQHTKKQRHYFANKGPSSQSYGFSGSHVQMWELDHKEGWAPKNWCFWTMMLEKILKSPMDCEKIKPVNLKGNEPWIFIGRTDAEAEAPVLWPSDAKNWLIGKASDAGKYWGQEERAMTEDEMIGCIIDTVDMILSKLQEIVNDREAWHDAAHGITKSRTWLRDWTTIIHTDIYYYIAHISLLFLYLEWFNML